MFIVEGADCLGKTTAIQAMRKLTKDWNPPILYSHMGRPAESFDFFKEYKPLITRYTIQDRFHLGGLVWHKDRITDETLRVIQSWLRLEASVLVVFIASDYRWYEKKLKEDTRGNLFDPTAILEANQKYTRILHKPYTYDIDFVWDVKNIHNKEPQYPSENVMGGWLLKWSERLQYMKGL
jgi:hypothetical protein